MNDKLEELVDKLLKIVNLGKDSRSIRGIYGKLLRITLFGERII